MQQFDELRQNDRDVHDRVTDARKWLWAGGHRWPLVNASDIASARIGHIRRLSRAPVKRGG
jgi:hypothetical protein